MIGVLSQRTHLFGGTVRDNLLMARPDANDADLLRVTGQAHLSAFIQALPQGLDTWIGEQGLQISAGERQRLAIARALLQDTPILLLDEPSANLDTLTERDLLQTIHKLMDGRTALFITHRLVGLEKMDEILVLEAGRIVERGRHQDLVQAPTLYRRLWQLQEGTPVAPSGGVSLIAAPQ